MKTRLLTLSLGSALLIGPGGAKAADRGPSAAPAAPSSSAPPAGGAAGPASSVPPGDGRVPIDARDDRVQRRAIRGGTLDASRESQELRELRLFEQESFPKSGLRESMSLGGREVGGVPGQASGLGAGLGPDALPEGLRSPLGPRGEAPGPGENGSSQGQGTSGTSGTSVPWLSALKLLDNLGLAPTFVRFEAHVIKYLEFYKEERRGRSIMASWLRKQGRYKSLIEQALDKYGLPRFLMYVAMIESGFDPHDRSHKGAVGLWQFMPEGARIYGLRVDYWVDERQDPVRSTEAAARYLGDLKARFGSWHLALAAFNAGYGAVLRAMQKYNTNDYWELCRHEDGLPWETLLYVPKAIATALVGENKGFFGYEEVAADPPVSFDGVPVTGSVSLAAAARAIGIPVEDLARINPHLRRGRTPPLKPGETWELRLPAGTAERFSRSPEGKGEPGSERLVAYVVRFGERLEDIAKQRGVSASQLRRINGLVGGEDQAEIRTGVTLLVPEVPDRPGHAERARPEPPAPLTPEEIVVVAVPDKDMVVPGKKRIFYRVIPGDSIWAIARFFKVRDADLMRWNNLDPEATLATKMVLDVWVDKDFEVTSAVLVDPARVRVVTTGSEEFFELVEALRGRRRQKLTCQSGDTWEKLAKRCGLTVADLERINRVGRGSELKPGQTVVVYQNLSASERAEALRKLLPGVHIASAKEPDRAVEKSANTSTNKSSDRASDPAKDGEPDSDTRETSAQEASPSPEAAAPVVSGPPAPKAAAVPPASTRSAKAAPSSAAYGPPRPWRSPTGPALPAPEPARPAEPYGPYGPPPPPKEEAPAEQALPAPPPLPPELPAPPLAPSEPSGSSDGAQAPPEAPPAS